MVPVNHRYMFVFIKVNRTASTTRKSFFQKFYFSEGKEKNTNPSKLMRLSLLNTLLLAQEIPKKIFKG